jgi:hypothetical protein
MPRQHGLYAVEKADLKEDDSGFVVGNAVAAALSPP